jgi:hypothetical protein
MTARSEPVVPEDQPHGSAEQLNQELRTLRGLAFLFFEPSYGDELKAHFGSAPSAKSGSHIIYTRGSRWIVGELHGQGRPAPDGQPTLDKGTAVKEVAAIGEPTGYRLEVRLVDGSHFAVVPDPDPDLEPGEQTPLLEDSFADWEVFTPGGCLWAGPGLQWGFVSGKEG